MTRRVGHARSEQGRRCVSRAMLPDETCEGRRPHQRGVARQHDHIPLGVGEGLRERRQGHGQRVAGPAVGRLLDELDRYPRGAFSISVFVTHSPWCPTTTTTRSTRSSARASRT